MSEEPAAPTDLLALTVEIVSAHVGNNAVHTADLPNMIAAVHGALAKLGVPEPATPAEPEHKPAVTARKSLASDEHIISMIDGKPYKTLRRHLGKHGLTDREYRARYHLPADYPMVAKAYSAARSGMARTIGLGRRLGGKIAAAADVVESKVEEAAAPAVEKAKRGAKKAAAKVEEVAKPAAKRRRKAAA